MRLAVGEGTSLMATGRSRKGERKMTEKQEKICAQYSARDESGKVHCCDCPLVVDREMMMCKKNAVYNRKTRRWEAKDSMMNLGEIMKRERIKQGLSQQRLAELAGVTDRAISLWETGKREMRVDSADKVFKALGISVVIGGRS